MMTVTIMCDHQICDVCFTKNEDIFRFRLSQLKIEATEPIALPSY